jgi:hypothetical protein
VSSLIMSTLVNSKASALNYGFSHLLALALSFWLWPFFQYFVLEIALAYRRDLKSAIARRPIRNGRDAAAE